MIHVSYTICAKTIMKKKQKNEKKCQEKFFVVVQTDHLLGPGGC